jgi:hypothetical protein
MIVQSRPLAMSACSAAYFIILRCRNRKRRRVARRHEDHVVGDALDGRADGLRLPSRSMLAGARRQSRCIAGSPSRTR